MYVYQENYATPREIDFKALGSVCCRIGLTLQGDAIILTEVESDNPIQPGVAIKHKHFRTYIPKQNIIAKVAGNEVIALAPVDRVVSLTSEHRVIYEIAVDHIALKIAVYQIRIASAVKAIQALSSK